MVHGRMPTHLARTCKPAIDIQMTDSDSTDHFLEIRDASKTFATPEGESFRALENISLPVRNNEFVTLLGPSGCGKTTLLRTISGLEDLGGNHDRWTVHDRYPAASPSGQYRFPELCPLSVGDNVGYSLDVARAHRARQTGR